MLSSVGVTLHKRTCSMPGMGEVYALFSLPDTCCGKEISKKHCEEDSGTQKRVPLDPCCDFSLDFWNVDHQTQVLSSLDLSAQVHFTPVTLPELYDLDIHFSLSDFSIYDPDDSPPPKSARELLIFHHVFII